MAKKKGKKTQKQNESQQSVQQHIKNLQKLPIKERRNELAEIEIRDGRNVRSKIESELKLIQAEQDYRQDAEYFYDKDENINIFPKDFEDFPVIKQKIFRQINTKRKNELRKQAKGLKQDNTLIEKLLLYRIKHEKDKYSSHLIPNEDLKGLNTAINTEVDRLFYLHKKLSAHHFKNPTSSIYGLSIEEKDILKKIKEGYYWSKIKKQNAPRKVKKRDLKKKIIAKLPESKKKEANALLNRLWYRKEELTEEELRILRAANYQESNDSHLVIDFDGKRIACIGFKEGGFASEGNYTDKREKLNHFSKPYLLKELSSATKILQSIEIGKGERRIIDAVLTAYDGKKEIKIAVEFQESHRISQNEIEEKFKPITEKFDKLIIVCPRKYKEVYQKLEGESVFIFHYGEFTEFLRKSNLLGPSTSKK